ncbi:aldo/keto reductase, partial [Candidatus Bipolaricaulota bacterium]|nr:aldo/keto reductase [Candidatus Bipolaricaulota bacterium]
MRFRRLGKTDLRVSVIGLGTYQFGGRWGKAFMPKEVAEIIDTAKDNGINFIDTAECYGMNQLSENLVGGAIASSRSHWVLATKFGHEKLSPTKNRSAYTAPEMLKQLETSLRALRTDYVDLYQFHSGSNEAFDNDELWTMLEKQKQAGKIRHLGISVSRKSKEWR